MDIRTLSNPLAVLAAVMVVGVLSLLIVESRAVEDEYYVSHTERTRALETTRTDIGAALAGMSSAFETGGAVSPSVELIFARLGENNRVLQGYSDVPRQSPDVQLKLEQFESALLHVLVNGEIFTARQNTLADVLQTMQDKSPNLVKELRERNLPTQSRSVFALAIDIIEYATGQGTSDPAQLHDRIEEIRNDSDLESVAPGLAAEFLGRATSVIEEHRVAELTLAAIKGSTVGADLSALDRALADFNRSTVSRAETARVLLSVCAILLLLGAAYAIYRLQSSYNALNRSNTALQLSNDTLEERVSARTEQLESAYDDLKESQVQLIHAEKMSSLGEMIAGVSHEINTPLWYLMSNSSVLQERLDTVGELCEVAESMVVAVMSGSESRETVRRGLIDMHRMLKAGMKDDIEEARSLIQDSIDGLDELSLLAQGLKDFSRLDRAQHAPFNVNEGLDKALLIMNNRIKNRIKVHKHYADVPMIHCSPSQINQIFLNLLTNAADAIEDDGDIVLQTLEDNDNVVINIGDTGAGIPADVLPRIRDPFFTTKEVGQGTGLGLSIVDQIVTAHKGELHVDSKPGKGTTFTVILPVFEHGSVVIEHEHDDDFPQILNVDVAVMNKGNGNLMDGRPDAGDGRV